MTTTERPRTRPAPTPGPNPASRGVILVVVGVVLGLILLVRGGGVGFDDDATNVEIESGAEVTTTLPPAATTTVPPAQPPAAVRVVVANGSGVSGLAGRGAQVLARAGYTTASATDALQNATTTVVYFSPGFEANAAAVATALGLPGDRVQALAGQVAEDQPTDAGVVVVLGPDAQATINAAGAGASTTVAGGTSTPSTTAQPATTARPTTAP